MDYNSSNNTALANLCVYANYVNSAGYATLQIVGSTAETMTLTFDTNASHCYAAAPAGGTPLRILSGTKMSKNNAPNPTSGTYTITLTGHDSVTSSITAQTTFT